MRRFLTTSLSHWLGLVLLLGSAAGCVNKQRMTEPIRSVGEQSLFCTAIDRALSELDLEAIGRLKGFKVYLSTVYLQTLDQEYLVGSLRDLLLSSGVLVVADIAQAQMVVEVRRGATSSGLPCRLSGAHFFLRHIARKCLRPALPVPRPHPAALYGRARVACN